MDLRSVKDETLIAVKSHRHEQRIHCFVFHTGILHFGREAREGGDLSAETGEPGSASSRLYGVHSGGTKAEKENPLKRNFDYQQFASIVPSNGKRSKLDMAGRCREMRNEESWKVSETDRDRTDYQIGLKPSPHSAYFRFRLPYFSRLEKGAGRISPPGHWPSLASPIFLSQTPDLVSPSHMNAQNKIDIDYLEPTNFYESSGGNLIASSPVASVYDSRQATTW
jgi:hypothetical protein